MTIDTLPVIVGSYQRHEGISFPRYTNHRKYQFGIIPRTHHEREIIMAFVEDLSPQHDITKFVPDHILSDKTQPAVIPSLMPYLRDNKLNMRKAVGFLSGAYDHQEIVNKAIPGDERSHSWFKTSEVKDVRVFFRASQKDPDRAIGSKVRLYSMGRPYNARGDQEEIQHIDSGFLRFNLGATDPDMVFQNALASTMFYRSVYCIGGPAVVRKISIPAEEGDRAPSYKWMSAMNPKHDPSIDRRSYEHILHPALDAAGVERDFFSEKTLDDLVLVFTESKDIKDVETRLINLADEDIDREFALDIIAHSNTQEANLDNASPDDFDPSPGLNLVMTLRFLADNLVDE